MFEAAKERFYPETFATEAQARECIAGTVPMMFGRGFDAPT